MCPALLCLLFLGSLPCTAGIHNGNDLNQFCEKYNQRVAFGVLDEDIQSFGPLIYGLTVLFLTIPFTLR